MSEDHSPLTTHHSPNEVAVLIPAAGRGARLGGARKQFRSLGGRSVLAQTLRAFERCAAVGSAVVAAPPGEEDAVKEQLRGAGQKKHCTVVAGGGSRQASVRRALAAVPAVVRIVLVHDAVRPFVAPERIAAVVAAVEAHGAAALAVPVADTLRRMQEGERETPPRFGETVEREGCFQMQTPQGFRRAWLDEALAQAQGAPATDDVALVQRTGRPVCIVTGDRRNFKITTPADWQLAQALWSVWVERLKVDG